MARIGTDATRRALLATAGAASVGLGTLGLFVPMLPTTPFLLLSAYCFDRSSPALHGWLVGHRHLGPYLERYRAGRPLARRDVAVALVLMWTSIGWSATYATSHTAVRIGLIGIATAVTVYLVSRTRRPSQ